MYIYPVLSTIQKPAKMYDTKTVAQQTEKPVECSSNIVTQQP